MTLPNATTSSSKYLLADNWKHTGAPSNKSGMYLFCSILSISDRGFNLESFKSIPGFCVKPVGKTKVGKSSYLKSVE